MEYILFSVLSMNTYGTLHRVPYVFIDILPVPAGLCLIIKTRIPLKSVGGRRQRQVDYEPPSLADFKTFQIHQLAACRFPFFPFRTRIIINYLL